jgi:uncharacterized protein (DUF2062 family)
MVMLTEMGEQSLESMKIKVAAWLGQGVSPRRLALTLALGFAIGCIPVVGIPTLLCAALALALGLNQPAIQAANYAAMPLQLLLIVPFFRLGGWLFRASPIHVSQIAALLRISPADLIRQHSLTTQLLTQLTGLFGHAMLAWLLIAIPAVVLLTLALTALLRQLREWAPAEATAGD